MHKVIEKSYRFAWLLFLLVVTVNPSAAQKQQKTSDSKSDAEVKKPVRDSARDPFKKYEPPRVLLKKAMPAPIPSIQERIEQYRAQKIAAMNAHIAAPKPTTALLLNEIQIVGISRTPRGYAAIVEATPIRMSYVIYPGERFYDGQLVAIEDTRLVFRREVVWTDGRREKSSELKSLRPYSAVEAMTAIKTPPPPSPAADAEKKSDNKSAAADTDKKADNKPAATDKP